MIECWAYNALFVTRNVHYRNYARSFAVKTRTRLEHHLFNISLPLNLCENPALIFAERNYIWNVL